MATDAFDMAVAHRVFRNELHNIPHLIREVTTGDKARAAAVGAHLELITAALHHHHAAEDELIWPKLHARAPAFAEDISRMEDAHLGIAEADSAVRSILGSWTTSADTRLAQQLIHAVGELSARVDSHLDDEEQNIVPLINEHITAEEWEQCAARGAEFLSRKSLKLALVLGGLTFDVASADEARRILANVPLPQRVLISLLAKPALKRYRANLDAQCTAVPSSWHDLQASAAGGSPIVDILESFRTCELTTMSRDGSPQTWPICPLLLPDGRFLACTSIGLPQKAFNIRRNPKVSMLFSEPTASGIAEPGAVLIQGSAIAGDHIVADVDADHDLRRLLERVSSRQPAGVFMSSWLGRRLFPFYYVRIVFHVTPVRGFYWPTRDFSSSPIEIDLEELSDVV